MYRSLLFVFFFVMAAVTARSQELLLSALEVFSIEPGRILKHEARLIGNIGNCKIDVIKVSDVRGDTSRKAVRIWSRSFEPLEDWALNFDPAEAYGILNLLEHCYREFPQNTKEGQTFVYTTSNSLQSSITLPPKNKVSWGAVYFRQLYAYSNVEVPRRSIAVNFREIENLIGLWKLALDTLKEM